MKGLMLRTGELPVRNALISVEAPKESLLGLDVEGYSIVMDDEAHRRIVACVNACRGIETPELENGTLFKPRLARIKADMLAQSDELTVALRERDEARAMVAELVKDIDKRGGYVLDYACKQCVGNQAISETFICAYHKAKALHV